MVTIVQKGISREALQSLFAGRLKKEDNLLLDTNILLYLLAGDQTLPVKPVFARLIFFGDGQHG